MVSAVELAKSVLKTFFAWILSIVPFMPIPDSSTVHFVIQHQAFILIELSEHSVIHFSLISLLNNSGTEQHSRSLNLDTFGVFSQDASAVNDAVTVKSSDEQCFMCRGSEKSKKKKIIMKFDWLHIFVTINLRIAMKCMRSPQWKLQEDIDRSKKSLNSWLNCRWWLVMWSNMKWFRYWIKA